MRNILIIDSDVAIGIFYDLYLYNRLHCYRAISHLGQQYFQVWIPSQVEREFFNFYKTKKRQKILEEIYSDFQFIKKCPIPVSRNEVNIDNNFSDKDKGETEALLQAAKARIVSSDRLNFTDVLLLFKDKGAIMRANKKDLKVLKYSDFRSQMLEVGVVLSR